MKNKLKTIPDFVVRHVDEVMADAQAVISRPGGSIPALRYFKGGHEFSLPISYEYFVRIGNKMGQMARASAYIERMGVEFAFFAAEIAARATDPAASLEDQVNFVHEIGHVLYHISPQAYFVSMPIRVFSSTSEFDRLINLLFGGVPQPSEPNAIMVMGCNMVRNYTMISPFSTGDDGHASYAKPKIYDSLSGDSNDSLFPGIYDPSRN